MRTKPTKLSLPRVELIARPTLSKGNVKPAIK